MRTSCGHAPTVMPGSVDVTISCHDDPNVATRAPLPRVDLVPTGTCPAIAEVAEYLATRKAENLYLVAELQRLVAAGEFVGEGREARR